MTTALPSIFSVMIFTSPAFLSLKLSNFWITASATPMPVAYGRGREPSRVSREPSRAARAAAVRKGSMRCVAGGDARRCVSEGENVEFFRGARRGAFAGKCVSAGGVELRAAARRRKECLPPLALLQTRAAPPRS